MIYDVQDYLCEKGGIGKFLENLVSQRFILPPSKIKRTVENYYGKIYGTVKIVKYYKFNEFFFQ